MKHTSLLLLLLITSFTYSQKNVAFSDMFEATASKPYPVTNGGKSYLQVGKNILAIKFTVDKITIQRYEGDHPEFAAENTIPLTGDDVRIENFLKIKDRIFLFYSVNKAPNTQLYQREIGVEQVNFIAKEQLLLDVPYEINKFFLRFNLETSLDNSKLVVTYSHGEKERKKEEKENFNITMVHSFDEQLEQLWKAEYQMPYELSKSRLLDYFVDNSGDVYWLYSVALTDFNDRHAFDVAPALRLLYANGDRAIDVSEIATDNLFVKSAGIWQNNKNQIICCGYYEPEVDKGATGIFTMAINAGKPAKLIPQPFPQAIISAYGPPKKKMIGISGLKLRHGELMEDGSFIITGEETYYEMHSKTLVERHANLVVSSVTAKGAIIWSQKVPRLEAGYILGYTTINTPSGIHYLFFDNPKNATLTIDKRAENQAGEILTSYRLDRKTGEMTRHNILDISHFKGFQLVQFSFGRCFELTNHSFAFEAYNKGKKEDVMVTVEIKD